MSQQSPKDDGPLGQPLTAAAEESSLDPEDWRALRALSHEMLDEALNRPFHPRMQLRGRIDILEPQALHIEAGRIHAKLRVAGQVSLILN